MPLTISLSWSKQWVAEFSATEGSRWFVFLLVISLNNSTLTSDKTRSLMPVWF